jgi:hypothetical protein
VSERELEKLSSMFNVMRKKGNYLLKRVTKTTKLGLQRWTQRETTAQQAIKPP